MPHRLDRIKGAAAAPAAAAWVLGVQNDGSHRDHGDDEMPFYQFTIPAGGPSARRKAEIAAAVTRVHTDVTGAPAHYVNCSFVEVPAGSLFVAGEPVESGRMVGIIRQGRSEEVKRRLVLGLAEAWSAVTGEPADGFALFIHEVPGYQVMEKGVLLHEASEDRRTVEA
jgi:phenylpyruvate tautomerase PptA (4-oxalocrotonate tautomerase family)